MMKIKTSEIPKNAKDLYVQLYCEKTGDRTNESIHKATQSWISLSLTKKKHFYSTLSTKSVVKRAQRIIRTKPFLRARDPRNLRNIKGKIVGSNIDMQNEEPCIEFGISELDLSKQYEQMECDETGYAHADTISEALPGVSPGPSSCTCENTALQEEEGEKGSKDSQNEPYMSESPDKQNSYLGLIDEESSTPTTDNINVKEAKQLMPTEPIVPIIKNGKELFELLNSRNQTKQVAYESLTAREKRFYGNAVCRIKRDFVTHYKAYLESLTSRQLFDYYLKIF